LDRSRVGCRFFNGQSIDAATVNAAVIASRKMTDDFRKLE
jgi:hypothetical protein